MLLVRTLHEVHDVAFMLDTCVWYCGSFCGCDLKKIILKKILLVEVDLIFIYIWLKLWLKLRLNKK
jgi:hypothetical protein